MNQEKLEWENWEENYRLRFVPDCGKDEVCQSFWQANIDFISQLLSQERERVIALLEVIKDWPPPVEGAGEGLGALAGVGMYAQYEVDTKKHKEQIEKILKEFKQ